MQPRRKNVLAGCLVVLLLVVHLALSAYLAVRWSPNVDEPAHLAAGMALWQYGKLDVYSVNPPLVRGLASLPAFLMPHQQAWGDFQGAPTPRPEFVLGKQLVDSHPARWRRFLIAGRWALLPFSILGGLFCYLWAAELYGRKAGLMALSLWCFSPNILTWSSLICTDAAAAAMGVGAGYCFWRWLKQPTWERAAAAGALLGLAQLSKMTMLVLFAAWPAVWLLWRRTCEERKLEQPQAVKLAAILLMGLYVLNLGYGFEGSFRGLGEFEFHSRLFSGVDSPSGDEQSRGSRFADSALHWLPAPLPGPYVRGMDLQRADFEEGEPSYLFGRWSEKGWWYYYLVGLGLKVPLGTWGLAVVAAVGYCSWFRRRDSSSPEQKCRPSSVADDAAVLVPALAVLALVSSQDGMSVHFRYVLPVLPFAFVWSSQAANRLARDKIVVSTLVLVVLGWSVAGSLSVYPHSMTYFNELAGGPSQGHRFMLGSSFSWSQDHFALNKWLKAHPEVDSPYMLLETSVSMERIGLRARGAPPPGKTAQAGNDASRLDIHGPVPGWQIISRKRMLQPDGGYLYFLQFEPTATIGNSIDIYNIDLDEANRVRRGNGLGELARPHVTPTTLLAQMQEASRSSRTLNVALFAAMQPNATSGELIERALWAVRDFSVTPLSEQGIRQGALKDFDVLVVPGGKASVQGSALGSRGRTAIRQFVREGGGYVGICAGAHLAAVNYDWSLKLVNARTISGQRYVPGRGVVSASFRGWGTVSIVGTDKSRGVLGTTARDFRADYTGGPIFIRANRANLPDYVPLAHFHSEVWKYPFQKGTMAGTPAILAAAFGGGRVILFSPHPETATTGEQLLKHAVRAASPAP